MDERTKMLVALMVGWVVRWGCDSEDCRWPSGMEHSEVAARAIGQRIQEEGCPHGPYFDDEGFSDE